MEPPGRAGGGGQANGPGAGGGPYPSLGNGNAHARRPPLLIFVDCEAPYGVGSPAVGDMTEFGAVDYETRETFHGTDASRETFDRFLVWLLARADGGARRLTFVSDNPAYDWQWVNFYFWRYYGMNPFGHSARRIGDFYAGLVGDFRRSNEWKVMRVTKHDHNPVNDAMGNVEAFDKMLGGDRARRR